MVNTSALQITDERFLCIVHLWLILSLCPVCRIVSCPGPSDSASKKRPGCWRVSSILTLSASTTRGRGPAKERNVLFWSQSSWHLARSKREYMRAKIIFPKCYLRDYGREEKTKLPRKSSVPSDRDEMNKENRLEGGVTTYKTSW